MQTMTVQRDALPKDIWYTTITPPPPFRLIEVCLAGYEDDPILCMMVPYPYSNQSFYLVLGPATTQPYTGTAPITKWRYPPEKVTVTITSEPQS